MVTFRALEELDHDHGTVKLLDCMLSFLVRSMRLTISLSPLQE